MLACGLRTLTALTEVPGSVSSTLGFWLTTSVTAVPRLLPLLLAFAGNHIHNPRTYMQGVCLSVFMEYHCSKDFILDGKGLAQRNEELACGHD